MTAGIPRPETSDEVLAFIYEQPRVFVRVAGSAQRDGSWSVELLEMVAGAPPPAWRNLTWQYPIAVVSAVEAPGGDVAEWLSRGSIPAGRQQLALPQLYANASFDRYASQAPSSFEVLDWPAMEARLGQPSGQVSRQEHLISEHAPSFRNVYVAAASLFGFGRTQNESFNQGIVYRHQDTRGRLLSVRIGADEVLVKIDGDAVEGMIIELAGDDPGPSTVVRAGEREAIRFPLTGGLPAGAWVVLRTATEWIDRRFLAGPWRRQSEPGVEFVALGTRLEALLANREGPDIEFKETMPNARESVRSVMKTVCAFANGAGGSILVGITDEHVAVGVPGDQFDRLRDQLMDLVYGWVHPTPVVNFEALPIEDSLSIVMEVRVAQGDSLYACTTANEATRIYIRHGAKTVPARVDEIERIVQARRAAPPSRVFG